MSNQIFINEEMLPIYIYILYDLVIRTESKYCFKRLGHGVKNVIKS